MDLENALKMAQFATPRWHFLDSERDLIFLNNSHHMVGTMPAPEEFWSGVVKITPDYNFERDSFQPFQYEVDSFEFVEGLAEFTGLQDDQGNEFFASLTKGGAFMLPNGNAFVAIVGDGAFEVADPWTGPEMVWAVSKDDENLGGFQVEGRTIKYTLGCTDLSSDAYDEAAPYMYMLEHCEESTGCNGLLGDANTDGAVNVLDAVLLVGGIFGESNDPCIDLNADGALNVLDAVLLIQHILSEQ